MTLEKIDHYVDVQFPAHGILDQTILKDPNDPAPSRIGRDKSFPSTMSTFMDNLPDLNAKKPLASHIDEEELTATLDNTIKPTHLESLQSSLSSLTQSYTLQEKQLQQLIGRQKQQTALITKHYNEH